MNRLVYFRESLHYISIISMAKVCELCDRGYLKGNSRSHSNIATIKRQRVNLQNATIAGKRVRACTRCIRSAAHGTAVETVAEAAK